MCQHFHYYVYDNKITIITDHKPLEKLLSSTSNPTLHIQRWLLRLQAYDTTIQYPGSTNAADYLSRHPSIYSTELNDQCAEHFINMISNHASPKSCKDTCKDTTLQHVIESIQKNNWSKHLQPYYAIHNQLSIYNNVLLKDNQIIIPKNLRHSVLQIAHSQHQGIQKMKNLLCQKAWWPTFNHDVEELIKHCHPCQVNTAPKSHSQPLELPETPQNNWEKLAVDLKGPLPSSESILVIIDYKSRYPIAVPLKSTTTEIIIKEMEPVFTMLGYPEKLVLDNGPQFTSNDFEIYLLHHNIKHQLTSPYWPQANGEVKRFNRTLTKTIKCAVGKGKDWKAALQQFLLMYHTTLHTTTGISPAQMLFQHTPNNGLPTIKQNKKSIANNCEQEYREKNKECIDKKRLTKHKDFQKGEKVLIKQSRIKTKMDSFYEQNPFTITDNYNNSVKVKDNNGKVPIRNKAHVKHYFQKPQNQSSSSRPTPKINDENFEQDFITLFVNPTDTNNETDNMSTDSDETIPYTLSDDDTANDSSNSLDHPNYTTK